jgi:hypothetical protein
MSGISTSIHPEYVRGQRESAIAYSRRMDAGIAAANEKAEIRIKAVEDACASRVAAAERVAADYLRRALEAEQKLAVRS